MPGGCVALLQPLQQHAHMAVEGLLVCYKARNGRAFAGQSRKGLEARSGLELCCPPAAGGLRVAFDALALPLAHGVRWTGRWTDAAG
jgi:hypothetical protein